MKKSIIYLFLFTCAITALGGCFYYEHTDAAPGYCVLSDTSGHFFVKRSGNDWVYQSRNLVEDSKQSAINLTWEFYEGDKEKEKPDEISPVGTLTELSCGNN